MRRTALAEGLGFVINSFLQARSVLNPTGVAMNALDQYGQQLERQEKENRTRQEAEMRALVAEIQSLRATFENGRLVFHMDRSTVLELVENAMKKSLANREAAMTASFEIDQGQEPEREHDAVLVLPSRRIFLRFVPEGMPLAQFAVSYLERARSANPSEYWLLTPTEEQIDFPFEPIFTERGVSRGRLRTYNLTSLLAEMVGDQYEALSTYDAEGGFRFTVSKKQAPTGPKATP